MESYVPPPLVANDALVHDRIPPPDASWDEIQRFALTFDGYAYGGDFERTAAIAEHPDGQNLSELRTALFFEQRRWRHYGETPDAGALAQLRSLLAEIRRLVARNRAGGPA